MASVQSTVVRPEMKRTFLGRAWLNTTKEGGKSFINVRIDRGMKAELDETCVLQLWENKKREGKKDADYRLSVLIPA